MNLTSKKSMLTSIATILIIIGIGLLIYSHFSFKPRWVFIGNPPEPLEELTLQESTKTGGLTVVHIQKAEYGKTVSFSDDVGELQYPDFKILLNDIERTDTINDVDVKKAHFTITPLKFGEYPDIEVETEFTSAGPTFPKAFTLGEKTFKIRYGMFMPKFVDSVDGKVKDNPLKENEIIVETVTSSSDSSSDSHTFIKK